MSAEPYTSWQKKPSYTFRAAWLSKKNIRRQFAERLSLDFLSQDKAVPELVQLELRIKNRFKRQDGWHHFFTIDAMRIFDSFLKLKQDVKTFLKQDEFEAGGLEILLHEAASPVRMSKSQRIKLLDKFFKGLYAFPFDDEENHFFEHIEPFKDYAMVLSVEYTNFRRFWDGSFQEEDNPIKSLVGLDCKVERLAFDGDDKEGPTFLAQGVLELVDNTVRISDWEQSFESNDEVFESVAYEEVNIASEALEQQFYFEVLTKYEDES